MDVSLLTDADFLVGYDGRVGVSTDARHRVWSSADWKDEVIAVRVSECPVLVVSGVSGALERQRQRSIVVRH